MPTFRRQSLLLAGIGAVALLVLAGLTSAAPASKPLPPCSPPAFAGSIEAHSTRCIAPRVRTVRGPRGRRGRVGLKGGLGRTGPPGRSGATGATGLLGPAGGDGAIGPAGPDGAVGAGGPAGPAGPIGPAGSNGLSEYAYLYNTGAAVVPIEASVPLDSLGVMSVGITHPSPDSIVLADAGTYRIGFSVSGVEPNQMTLFVNGVAVPGGTYGSGAGTQQTTGEVIVAVGANASLSIRNHSSAAAVTLQTLAGGTQTNANASITIEKLA